MGAGGVVTVAAWDEIIKLGVEYGTKAEGLPCDVDRIGLLGCEGPTGTKVGNVGGMEVCMWAGSVVVGFDASFAVN